MCVVREARGESTWALRVVDAELTMRFGAGQEANQKRAPEKEQARVRKLVKAERAKRSKLQALGIEYDFVGYEGLRDERIPKRTKLD